jgi:hypothetical protein
MHHGSWFTWAADKIIFIIAKDQMVLTFTFCTKQSTIYSKLEKFTTKTVQLMEFYNKTVGDYPYKQYSIIQGGDGGMEYAMCTLILGQGLKVYLV